MSLYSAAVLSDDPAIGYWPDLLEESGGAGPDVTLSGAGPVKGPLVSDDEGAASFDGENDSGSVALDLSGAAVVTVEFWLLWDVNGTNDGFAMEFGPNANENPGFNLVWNNSTGGAEANTVSLKQRFSIGADRRYNFPRPSQGAWHHFAIVLAPEATPIVYIDGSAVAVGNDGSANSQSGTFGAATLYLMSRAGAALFGAGDLAHLAIYPGTLSAERVVAHFDAAFGVEELFRQGFPFPVNAPFVDFMPPAEGGVATFPLSARNPIVNT